MRFGAFPASGSRICPKALPGDRRIPRVAFHTLRRVPLISSRTASLRPLPSCRCCLHSLPGPTRPKPGGTSPIAEATSEGMRQRWPKPSLALRAHAGRNRRGHLTSPRAEAVGDAHAAGAEAVDSVVRSSSEEGSRTCPDYAATEVAGRAPRGPEGLHQPRLAVATTPPKWSGACGKPVLCLDDAPIRRSGPPRHQTGYSSRPASRPTPSPMCLAPRPEGLGAWRAWDVPARAGWDCVSRLAEALLLAPSPAPELVAPSASPVARRRRQRLFGEAVDFRAFLR